MMTNTKSDSSEYAYVLQELDLRYVMLKNITTNVTTFNVLKNKNTLQISTGNVCVYEITHKLIFQGLKVENGLKESLTASS